MDDEKMFPQRGLNAKLGARYRPERTFFCLWAPGTEEIKLNLYLEREGPVFRTYPMERENDLCSLILEGDYQGFYYTFEREGKEATDPYSRACSLNHRRSFIVDLSKTNPPGFLSDTFVDTPQEKAVIYETHVGDFTFDPSSGVKDPGKYTGFIEPGTHYKKFSTGFDHLKDLGITHVHLMPIQEFATGDESLDRFGDDDNYHWGYDPELYNVPEGMYSINPSDPPSRIYEFKSLVLALHQAGIGLILDVVYNHTWKTQDSNLNLLAPNAYYRFSGGHFSNGSGVGNEIASEKPMVGKLILDSLAYWQEEYHIDGFRFDLMALMDKETADQAVKRILAKNPRAVIYGEPWTGAESALPLDLQTRWKDQVKRDFALFNERYRKAIGGENEPGSRGFAQGNTDLVQEMAMGIRGSVPFMGEPGDLENPIETVNYFNCHDNLIWEDRLQSSVEKKDRIKPMTKLAFGLLLTSQGLPFFHAGNEFCRTKQMDPNSYHSPFSVNAIDWSFKEKNQDLVLYVKELINLRKAYPVFSLRTGEEVRKRVKRCPISSDNILAFLYQVDTESQNNWLLVVHYNGWNSLRLSEEFLFRELKCSQIDIQKIFDPWGEILVNRVSSSISDHESLELEPLSTTIFKLKRGGVKYEL